MIDIIHVIQAEDIKVVASLAKEIWNDHYVEIIGQNQVDYMLNTVQSEAAITRQLAENYRYYFLKNEHLPTAYFAFKPNFNQSSAQISKLYVRKINQGCGLGRTIIAFIEDQCKQLGIGKLWLTVNRNNDGSIDFYKKVGFRIESCLVQDIGNGFVMDDYKMKKSMD